MVSSAPGFGSLIQVSYCWQSFLPDDNEDTSSRKPRGVGNLLDGATKIRRYQSLYHTRALGRLGAPLWINMAKCFVPSQPSAEKLYHTLIEKD